MSMPRYPSKECPECGSERTIRIIYGLAVKPPDDPAILGGCVIRPGSPEWTCEGCGFAWRYVRDEDVRIIEVKAVDPSLVPSRPRP